MFLLELLVVAMLLIPYLAKISLVEMTEEEEELRTSQLKSKFEIDAYRKSKSLKGERMSDNHIISSVLKMILADSTGSSSLSQPLTRDLIRQIFQYYGESELVTNDELIDEMILVASGGEENPELNVESFLRALTDDTKLYDAGDESKFQTHYEDVFGLVTDERQNGQHRLVASDNEDNDDAEAGPYDLSGSNTRPVKRIFTFPQIDFLADTFRSKAQYIFAWLGVVQFYVFYLSGSTPQVEVCKEENADSFGCKVGQSIVLWIMIMLQMV